MGRESVMSFPWKGVLGQRAKGPNSLREGVGRREETVKVPGQVQRARCGGHSSRARVVLTGPADPVRTVGGLETGLWGCWTQGFNALVAKMKSFCVGMWH